MAQADKKDLPADKFSCGYCLESLSSMTDPRELPCSHVCCLSCLLQADDIKNGKLTCPNPKCRQVADGFCYCQSGLKSPSTRAETAFSGVRTFGQSMRFATRYKYFEMLLNAMCKHDDKSDLFQFLLLFYSFSHLYTCILFHLLEFTFDINVCALQFSL